MNDTSDTQGPVFSIQAIVAKRLAWRKRRDRRFKRLGLLAVGTGLLLLCILFGSILSKGYGAFWRTEILLTIDFSTAVITAEGHDLAVLQDADYARLLKDALKARFPQVKKRKERRQLYRLLSLGAEDQLRAWIIQNPEWIGRQHTLWLLADDDVDQYYKHGAAQSRLNAAQRSWIEELRAHGQIRKTFNTAFFTAGDSREPELAGIHGALVGSLLVIGVTLALSLPLGVATAIYLEEFAPKNCWIEWIEININNLAAVPSVVFGLLGLAVFIDFLGLPRASALVGGLVLALMTLPTIIIASRAALKTVPPSIREAALGMGASQMQTLFQHVLPLAAPGILTGSIIGIAQALGETAPLLMIGMVAFIADTPTGPLDSANVLPVQIYLWADSPERAFMERTAAAIMVLLVLLILINLIAIGLRKHFERRW